MDNYLKITVPFLLITVAALYGIRRRKLAGNQMNSCKGFEMVSSQRQLRQDPESENEMGSEKDEFLNEGFEMVSSRKQLRQAPESENEMGSEKDEFLNEVDDTSKKNCSILVDTASLSLPMTDRLSELPDEILSHIITYLSLRDVARVATLSKNWRKVSLSLCCLNLDWKTISGMPNCYHGDGCERYKQAYVNGVNQVLPNYKDQNIVSFRLQMCCLDNTYAAVNQWISFAAKYKGLQSLTIRFACWDSLTKAYSSTYNETHVISGTFLSQFSLLRNLHLHSCRLRLENDLRLSNSLTSLDLCDVILEGTQWQSFLSSLSTLECLSLRRLDLPEKLCIDDQFSRLSFLRIHLRDLSELELSARNLKTFQFVFIRPVECSFSYVSSLENVYMYYGRQDHVAGVILNSLAAKALNLKSVYVRGVNYLVHKQPSCQGLLFPSVLSFRLLVKDDDSNFLEAVLHLLKSFPLLKKLDIQFSSWPSGRMYKVPIPYLHDNLKEVKLSLFNEQWIPVAIFLLQCAVGLNRMMLTKSSRRYYFFERSYMNEDKLSEKECEIIRKALMGKASSPHAQIIIEQLDSFDRAGHWLEGHEEVLGTKPFL